MRDMRRRAGLFVLDRDNDFIGMHDILMPQQFTNKIRIGSLGIEQIHTILQSITLVGKRSNLRLTLL